MFLKKLREEYLIWKMFDGHYNNKKVNYINSLQSISWRLKHQNIACNFFKVKTKDIRTMSMASFWCSGVFVNKFGKISRIILGFPL